MATIQIRSDFPHTYVGVPNAFIDTYMAEANGEFVKVYLYLLRCMNCPSSSCSISAIADHFNHTEKDVLRALKYWEKVGVIGLEFDANKQISSLCFKDLNEVVQDKTSIITDAAIVLEASTEYTPSPIIEKTASGSSPKKGKLRTLSPSSAFTAKCYTLDEKKKFAEDPEIAELLFIMESYLQKPLSSVDMDTVFFWLDELGFSRELVEYLVESSIESKHKSIRFMNKKAIEWAELGITTIEQAKLLPKNMSKEYYAVMNAFGITGRILIDSEIVLVKKWLYEYCFSMEIIEEACKRTIEKSHQPNFGYADSILTDWHKNNVHTLKDIVALDEVFNKNKRITNTQKNSASQKRNNKFNNFQQREYDPAEYEKMLLTTSVW